MADRAGRPPRPPCESPPFRIGPVGRGWARMHTAKPQACAHLVADQARTRGPRSGPKALRGCGVNSRRKNVPDAKRLTKSRKFTADVPVKSSVRRKQDGAAAMRRRPRVARKKAFARGSNDAQCAASSGQRFGHRARKMIAHDRLGGSGGWWWWKLCRGGCVVWQDCAIASGLSVALG
jgi:hypothetical protein